MFKFVIWLGLFVGSSAGSYVPVLFGAGFLSLSSLLGGVVGGIAGIVAGYKLGQYWGL